VVRFSPWELDEWRRSRPVLEGPRGETPRGYLTLTHYPILKAFWLKSSLDAFVFFGFFFSRFGAFLFPMPE